MLGPWVNSRKLNALTGVIIGVLVILSVVLTASVLFPTITGTQIVGVVAGGIVIGLLVGVLLLLQARRRDLVTVDDAFAESGGPEQWRMPPLAATLSRPTMSLQRKISGLGTLRGYLGDRSRPRLREGHRGRRPFAGCSVEKKSNPSSSRRWTM